MATANLLALIDDIAAVLDDVAVLSKVAAKKSAGVLGDDLALNAEQVSGVKADRELPVVWAVAKGSMLNKVILVPAALLISAVYSPLITVLMVIGGLYLCFEGAEKIIHKLLHSSDKNKTEKSNSSIKDHNNAHSIKTDHEIEQLEKAKIKGAIRTDFILSAEIVVIVLGSVKDASFETQVAVLSGLAVAFTVGVYGLVAAIVKLDDLGLYLLKKSLTGEYNRLQRYAGKTILMFAPLLMKLLSIIGTIAMFLVGGGILVHSFSALHHFLEPLLMWGSEYINSTLMAMFVEGIVGIIAGLFVLMAVSGLTTFKSKASK